MQTSLMFVDLKPLGVTPDSQQIAIKFPKGNDGVAAESYAEFSDIISALMAATPEELQHSLENMEWIKVQGDGAGYAPLIDLSATTGNGTPMAQMLAPETGNNTMPKTDWASATGMVTVNTAEYTQEDGNTGRSASFGHLMPGPASDTRAEIPAQQAFSGKIPETDDLMPSQIRSEPGKSGPSGELKAAVPDMGTGGNISQNQIPLSDVTEDVREADRMRSAQGFMMDRAAKAQAQSRGEDKQDIPPLAIQPEETLTKEMRHREPQVTRTQAPQSFASVAGNADQNLGQQLTEHDGSDHEAQRFIKREVNEHRSSELSQSNFKPAFLEAAVDSSADGQDPMNSARGDSRVDLQAAAARMKTVSNTGVETVSGPHEPVSHTSDPQSNVIRQIVQRMTLHNQGMQSSMTVKLKPEFLGNVHMQISTDNQQVVVRMATESLAVKEMVEQGLQYLKTELQHHGLEIDKFDVFVSDDKERSNPGQDLAGFRQALKERRRNAHAQDSQTHGDVENNVSSTRDENGRAESQTSEIDYFA